MMCESDQPAEGEGQGAALPAPEGSEAAEQSEPGAQAGADATALATFKLQSQARTGSGWFFWVAGLSIINSLLFHAKAQFTFIFGLGLTQLIDAVAGEIQAPAATVVALVLDALAAALLIGIGLLARRGHTVAFVFGLLVYGADMLLVCALVALAMAGGQSMGAMEIIGVLFHVYVLFAIISGMRASVQLKRAAAQPAAGP